MAIDLKDFPKYLQDSIQSALDEVLSERNVSKMAEDVADQIRLRTRLGNGIDSNGGEPRKLEKLKESYIKERRKKPLSEETKATKSNLTRTGKMLNDIVGTAEGTSIVISFKDPDSAMKAKYNSEAVTYSEYRKPARPFFFVSRVQIQRITNEIEKKLGDQIKKNLK